jgi:hypothetical protein
MTESGSHKMKRVGSTGERLAQKPYHQRMCRTECYPGCVQPSATYEGVSVEEWVDFIDDLGMEVQIVDGELNRGTPRFHSKMIEPHKDVDSERLPRFLELAHERGIIILSYYPAIYTRPLKPIHPEWLMQFLDDGREPIENDGWFCINSPYRDWVSDYMIEWLDNLDLDGLYFDDTNYGSHQDGTPWFPSCCCDYCEKMFRDDTGADIPRKVDFDDAAFRRFVKWRYGRLIEFMQYLAGRIKEKHPDAILDFNSYVTSTTNWTFGHPLASFRLQEVDAVYFTETFRSLREVGLVAKIMRSTGTPFGHFRLTDEQLRGFGQAPFPSGNATAIAGLATMINGGAPCGGPMGEPSLINREANKWIFSEYKKRDVYVEGDTVKHVALHFSQMNRDYRPSERAKNTGQTHGHAFCIPDAIGAYELLNRSHFPLDIALDEHLAPDTLRQYSVLFLSNSACLSDEQCDAIRGFVADGGTLIATHQTSLLDEWGQERGQFALADLFGVDYRGPSGEVENSGRVLVPCTPELRRELGEVVFFYGVESAVSARSGAEVLCDSSSPEKVDPEHSFDPTLDYRTGAPAVTRNRFGKGQAIYVGGDVGGAYLKSPYPPLRRFVASLVGEIESPLTVEAPEAIEMVAARRDSGELMIHLLNNPTPVLPWDVATNELTGIFLANAEITPIRDVRIQFNQIKVTSASLPLHDQALEVAGDPPAVVVPLVDLHEVVLIQT